MFCGCWIDCWPILGMDGGFIGSHEKMKTEKVDILKIELEGQEATDFKKAIAKVVDENSRAGFQQSMTPEEKKVISEINDKIK